MVVNPDLRASLQAVPDAGVAASQLGPQLPTLVRQATQTQAGAELRVRADRFLWTQSYRPNKNWEFYFRAQHLRLAGTRPKGTGTFAREGNGPAGDGVWESLGVELPEPVEYRTTNITLGFQYSRPKWTNEHSVTGRLDYRPWRGVSLKADYLYGHRIPRRYPTQPLTFVPNLQGNLLGGWAALPTTQFARGVSLEFNLLRRFDDDERVRKDGGVSLEVTRSPKVTYAVSFRYMRDDYDRQFYGLHYDLQTRADAQVSYFPRGAQKDDDDKKTPPKDGWLENTFLYAEYSRDQEQTGYRDLGHLIIGAVQDVTACCAQFPFANTYDRSTRLHLDTFQFGVDTAGKGEKTSLDLSYVLSYAGDKTHTVNPFTILPISLRTAGAYNYPDVVNWQQEVNFTVTRRLRENLDLGFSYLFEPYRLDDYYTNNLQPYAGPRLVTDGGAASVPVARQLFLDARFTSYHANVATVFLRYKF